MPRRSKPKAQKRDLRWWASTLLNGAVALSMVLGTVFLFTGGPRPAPPTIEAPTVAPNSSVLTPAPLPTSPPAAPTVAPPTPTPTPKANVSDFHFAVAGDSRDGDAIFSQLLQDVSSDGSAFLIHLGDMVPTGSARDWTSFHGLMKDFHLPFYPIPGNHETIDGTLADFVHNSGAPATHYSFDRGMVHFTLLDSDTGTLNDAELAFLDQDLAATKLPVKLVFMHHPPFDPAGGSHILEKGSTQFMNIVTRRGVQSVFSGHIHCHAESERDGVTYIISGGAGSPLSCLPVTGGFFHYIRVYVSGTSVTTEVVKIE
jgi:3',5'-cyclic AMP phosphodiesterase CpdA